MKILSLLISLAGMIVVTLSAENDPENGITQTMGGYLAVTISTLIYAAYEVVFVRFSPRKSEEDGNSDDHHGNDIQGGSNRQYKTIDGSDSDSDSASDYSSSAYYTSDFVDIEVNNNKNNKNKNNTKATPSSSLLPRLNNSVKDFKKKEKKRKDEENEEDDEDDEITTTDSLFFLSIAGIFMLILTWPMFFVLNWTGVEPFELPDSYQWGLILITAFLDAFVNFFILLGIAWTSALFVDTGSLLAMPFSVIFDVIFHDYILPPIAFAGMIYVFLGFILLTLSDVLIDYKEKGKLSEMRPSLWRTTLLTLSAHWSLKPSDPDSPSSTPTSSSFKIARAIN